MDEQLDRPDADASPEVTSDAAAAAVDGDASPDVIADTLAGIGEGLQEDIEAQLLEATEPSPAATAAMQLELVARRYRLDGHTRDDLELVVAAHRQVLVDGTVPEGRKLSALRHGVGHEEVVAATIELLLGDGPDPDFVDALHTLAIALVDGASGTAEAGGRVLLGRCAEHRGDHRAMEAQVNAALEADPQYWPALLDAAWFAEDRGDALHAMSLLTETHVPAFAGEIERLSRFTRTGDAKVGRNDPCPCGSGRKYKACCLNQGGFNLADRSRWLLQKAQGYVARNPQRPVVDALVLAAAGDFKPELTDGYRIALDDYPMVVEVALFEGGLLRSFLDQRGHLLPADERELAEQWLEVPLAVWQVAATDGRNVEVARGDRRVPISRAGAMVDAALGTAVLLRPLPIPDGTYRVLCATAVPPEVGAEVEALLADTPTATDLARIIGVITHIPPPTIDGGDPLVLCSITYELPEDVDAQEVAARLDDELVDPDGNAEWFEPADLDAIPLDGDPEAEVAPPGSIVLYEDELLIRAGSEARAARLAAIVARLVPEASVKSDVRRPRSEIIADLLAR